MKKVMTAAFGLSVLFGVSGNAHAEVNYPWCIMGDTRGFECVFSSREQCMQDGRNRGFGGQCIQNPAYKPGPPTASGPVKKRTVLATAADAPVARCREQFDFRWGQHSEGWFSTRVGSPCRLTVSMLGQAIISSAEIIDGPHSGTAAPAADGSVRFQPNAGFTGKDTMTVRYRGTGGGAARVLRQATVTYSITVF
jgi:hypothetical protein